MAELTQERLKELLHYDPETGVFTCRGTRFGPRVRGDVVGSVHSQGYIVIRIDYAIYKAHRLAWLYTHGIFPDEDIDHINRVKSDNRISNLRVATRSQNSMNRPRQSNNKSGYKGVCWSKVAKRWHAQIKVNGQYSHLGYFDTPEAAHEAYANAARKYSEGYASAS